MHKAGTLFGILNHGKLLHSYSRYFFLRSTNVEIDSSQLSVICVTDVPASRAERSSPRPVNRSKCGFHAQASPDRRRVIAMRCSAISTGRSASLSKMCTCTPWHSDPAWFDAEGLKTVARKHTPGNWSLFNAAARANPSSQGAPQTSNGSAVPRPRDRLEPSSRHIPGYSVAVDRCGIAGDVGTHGRSV